MLNYTAVHFNLQSLCPFVFFFSCLCMNTLRKEPSSNSVSQVWLTLLSQTRQESRDHNGLSESCNNFLTQPLTHCVEYTQRLAKKVLLQALTHERTAMHFCSANDIILALLSFFHSHFNHQFMFFQILIFKVWRGSLCPCCVVSSHFSDILSVFSRVKTSAFSYKMGYSRLPQSYRRYVRNQPHRMFSVS